jgi:hypothetical protein
MPYERFVILLKSRSHYTYHHSHHSILFRPKYFTPTLGGNTQNIPLRFPSNKCSKVFVVISPKIFCMRKETCGYVKERIEKKMDKCLKYQTNGYFDSRLKKKKKKREEKDSPCFLAIISKFK